MVVGGRTASQGHWPVQWLEDAEDLGLQEVAQQNDRVAVWAMATQSDGASERVALRAALLSNASRFTGRALIHGVLSQLSSALQFRSDQHEVQPRWLTLAQPIRLLLADACAIPLLGWAQRCATDQAGA